MFWKFSWWMWRAMESEKKKTEMDEPNFRLHSLPNIQPLFWSWSALPRIGRPFGPGGTLRHGLLTYRTVRMMTRRVVIKAMRGFCSCESLSRIIVEMMRVRDKKNYWQTHGPFVIVIVIRVSVIAGAQKRGGCSKGHSLVRSHPHLLQLFAKR
jgi:hypothetical protein